MIDASQSRSAKGSPSDSMDPGAGPTRDPPISFPKGGGAIRGLGEKFAANPVTGTASFQVPIVSSPGRSGLGPELQLAYDSGSGNGFFGFGWTLSLPAITRRTDKGLPLYRDHEESDVFVLSGAEDLVPRLDSSLQRSSRQRVWHGIEYEVRSYRPRIEGLFARIERWCAISTGISHWRTITSGNITSLYGLDDTSRVADPEDPRRAFAYLIRETFDDKGNVIFYGYVREDDAG